MVLNLSGTSGITGAGIGTIGPSGSNITGVGTFTQVEIDDKIVHVGDTNTAIRFPSADTITAETGGSERLRIDSSGRMMVGNTAAASMYSVANNLVVGSGSGSEGMTIYSDSTNDGFICFADGASDPAYRIGQIIYSHQQDRFHFRTNGNTDRLLIDSNGNTNISGITTATHFNPTVQPYGTKNLIINGAVLISQRNGTSNTTIASSATYGPDRIAARTQTGSGHVLAQNTEAPAGFTYSAKVTIGTGGSPSAGNKNYLYQPIEGYNVAHLGGGTSDAKTVTLSFWVRSSVTGNFGAAITSGGSDQSYTFPYTISSADTWEKKTKTITLPTSGGTWNTNNTAGLTVFWDLGSGSDYEGTANQWNSALDVRSSSDVKLMATNSATWYVTGIQLEVGSVATPFEHRSQGDELRRCMRYCQKVFNAQLIGTMNTSSRMRIMTNFPVPMRGTPSYTRTSTDLSFQKAASNETSSNTTEAQGATTATADGNAYARTWDFGGFSSLADRTFIGGNGGHVFTLDSEM